MNQPHLMTVPYRKQGWIASKIEGVRLGDTNETMVRVLVQDLRDRPISGAEVLIFRVVSGVNTAQIATGVTNGNGTAVITAPLNADTTHLLISAKLPEGWMNVTVPLEEARNKVITFRSVELVSQPIVNTMEIVAATGGVALFVTGNYLLKKKVEPLSILGEILVIAAIFERIGRGL